MSAVLIFMFFIGLLVVSLGGCTYAVKKGMKPAKAVAMQLCSFAILFMASFASTAFVASAVAAAAPAAIGATSEDPKAFGKAIVFVGLAEGVSIFGLLIAIFIKFI